MIRIVLLWVLASLAVLMIVLDLSGYALLYNRSIFEEHSPYKDGTPVVVLRSLYACHYISASGFHYVVVPGTDAGWCKRLCKMASAYTGAFRAMGLPGYQVTTRPFCAR